MDYFICVRLVIFFILGFFIIGKLIAYLQKHELDNTNMICSIIFFLVLVVIDSLTFEREKLTSAILLAFGAIFGFYYYCKPKWINGIKQY